MWCILLQTYCTLLERPLKQWKGHLRGVSRK